MGCFQVRYDSRVVNYEHKLFIRLATGESKPIKLEVSHEGTLPLTKRVFSVLGQRFPNHCCGHGTLNLKKLCISLCIQQK